MSVILAVDPGESSGYAAITTSGELVGYGHFLVDTSSEFLGDWCISFQNSVSEIYKRFGASSIAIEDYYFSKKTCSGSIVNAAYRTAAYIWARQNKIDYVTVGITSWKTFVAGRSTPTPVQKKLWGAAPAKKMMIIDALFKRHGIRLPNHSISEKTLKPVMFKFDISDAVGQALYTVFLKHKVTSFSCNVALPPDLKMPKSYPYDDPPHFDLPLGRVNKKPNASKVANV